MTRVLLLHSRSRATLAALALCAVATLALLAAGPAVYELQIDSSRLPRFVPIWEFAPAVTAVCLPALLTSRMGVWERMGDPSRLRPLAAATAAVALALPPGITALGAATILPNDARWADIAMNVLTIAAISMLATVAFGRLLGPIVGFAFYLGAMIGPQLSEALERWGPLASGNRTLIAQTTIAVMLALFATAAWTAFLGRSTWADRIGDD